MHLLHSGWQIVLIVLNTTNYLLDHYFLRKNGVGYDRNGLDRVGSGRIGYDWMGCVKIFGTIGKIFFELRRLRLLPSPGEP